MKLVWICFGVVLSLFWVCFEVVLCFGVVLGVDLRFFLGLFWGCFEFVLGLCWGLFWGCLNIKYFVAMNEIFCCSPNVNDNNSK